MQAAQKVDSSGNASVVQSAGTTDSSYCMGVTQSTWMRYSKNCRRCDACVECTECDRCTFCIRCHGCTSCENATDCLDCTSCVGCTGCIGCTPQQNCGCQQPISSNDQSAKTTLGSRKPPSLPLPRADSHPLQ
jgi:hypothetical protein